MFDAFTAIGSESSSVNLDWERENDYFDSAEYARLAERIPCNCDNCGVRIDEGRCPKGY